MSNVDIFTFNFLLHVVPYPCTSSIYIDVGDIQICANGIERSDWRKALKVELNHQALPPLRSIALDAGADLEDHGYDILFSSMYDDRMRLQPLRILEIGKNGPH